MTEPIFEMPSSKVRKLVVDRDYARQQLENTNLNIISKQMSE